MNQTSKSNKELGVFELPSPLLSSSVLEYWSRAEAKLQERKNIWNRAKMQPTHCEKINLKIPTDLFKLKVFSVVIEVG